MGFVIDKQGEYLPVFGEATGGGGGGGTTNHAALSNLDYAHSGHTGFMSSENYIPTGTTLTIEEDGTGDFNTLNEAIAYLDDKWSIGNITIKFGEGTFVHSEPVSIRGGNRFFCPLLTVVGEGADKTILKFTHNTFTHAIRVYNTTAFDLRKLTVKRDGGDKSTDLRGILAAENAEVLLSNVTTDGCNYAVDAQQNATISLIANINIKNCNLGIGAEGGIVGGNWGVATTFDNVTTAFYVYGGGIIKVPFPTYTATNVTNISSQTVGTATNNGWITGLTV